MISSQPLWADKSPFVIHVYIFRVLQFWNMDVTCRFKTFGRFETAMAVLIPLRGLEMAWPFRNGQLFPLAVLIPHQFDIGGQVCSVAFKCNTIKTYIFIGTAFGLL